VRGITNPMNTTSAASSTAREFTATPFFEGMARAGYLARGAIYLLVGVLAFRLAEGVGSQPSQQGAMRTIAHQPFGHALLVLLAIGLVCYAIWRAAQAFVGRTPEAGQHSALDRIGALGSGIAYGVFAVIAIQLLRGSAKVASPNSTKKAAAGALTWPAGREIVAIAGLILLAVAAYQIYMGVSRKFLEDSKTGEMGPATRKAFTIVGTAGMTARGIAFGLMGLFALKAARDANAQDAVGLDGALYRVTTHAYGTVLLVLIALGLVAFGVYSIADARYRKI
jgi:hypothetical protein